MGLFYVPEIPNIMGLSYVLIIMGLFYVPRSLILWVFLMYGVPYTKGLSYVQLVLKLPDLPHTPPSLHKMDPYKENNFYRDHLMYIVISSQGHTPLGSTHCT